MDSVALVVPTFFAGVLTFLAPCTLPLVPGYLGFISGASFRDLRDPARAPAVRRAIFLNGVFYVIGFSVVFVALGSLLGLVGSFLIQYRVLLSRVGGVFVILFGLYMMNFLKLPFLRFLSVEHKLPLSSAIRPGNPLSSFIFGAAFAFGWTPCVGPVLGAVLALAATSATVGQGAFLLGVFSLGLAVPFLVIAAGIGSATRYISKLGRYLTFVSIIGGVFLVFLGVLLVTDSLGVWVATFFRVFSFVGYESLLDYL